MVKNDNSLWENLDKNTCKNQKKLLDKIKSEREKLKVLLENLHDSGYEISFKNKKNNKDNENTLRIRKIINSDEKHYGLISDEVLNKNKNTNNLFGYCLDFKCDYCPNDFPYNILGFPQDNGWFIYTKKEKSKVREYIIITSIDLAHKIFNLSK
ncbi:hypothetical protein [Cyanobacterium aponinum]|uniref:Uncharacterized protein n=1 Tax=Cyanobacterium aponinum (strain PCC 10605) TaxID=755178 RepID=K9Z7K8_CYAAP|nr:hypothetical protein [Cyanobacterium aponinum]AFZ54697.1 hypothetical protein Cyan10605_2622 [Cyanobacterium aponinum PCC 10605]